MGKYLVVVTFEDAEIESEPHAATFVEGVVRRETTGPANALAYKLERLPDEFSEPEEASEDHPKNFLKGAKN